MVVDTSIKITKATREKLYFLKGPDRDYNAVIEDLIEEHYSRPVPARMQPGTITKGVNE